MSAAARVFAAAVAAGFALAAAAQNEQKPLPRAGHDLMVRRIALMERLTEQVMERSMGHSE